MLTLPEPMARCLHQQARSLLAHAGIDEPVTWEPPFAWAAGITWPGPDPDGISPQDLHPLIRSGLPVRAIAARLGTTIDHVRLTAGRHPAPLPPDGRAAKAPPAPELPGTDQLRAFTGRGYGPRKIARITGCSERAIRQLLTSTGLRQPVPCPDSGLDPHWLREQYQSRQRSLKDIAAETGIPVETLAAAARAAGIAVRHGINGRAHPLASIGGPDAFPRTSGTPSPTRAPSSASAGSSPSPASPASITPPASSASGTPSSPARSASSKPPPTPRSCASKQTGPSP